MKTLDRILRKNEVRLVITSMVKPTEIYRPDSRDIDVLYYLQGI